MNEKEQIKQWQQNKDPETFVSLFSKYQPIVNKVTSKYKTIGIPEPTLKAKSNSQLINALNTYDPNKGTQPSTHIWNYLQKIQRDAISSKTSGAIPEHRNTKTATFSIVKDNLEDSLGREASIDELSEELKWNKEEVARTNNELGGETTASGADFDFYGNSTTFEHKDRALADYLYHDLTGPEKVTFEHTFGYGNKPILKNKDIAQKLNTNEMAVSRMKNKLSDKIKEYR